MCDSKLDHHCGGQLRGAAPVRVSDRYPDSVSLRSATRFPPGLRRMRGCSILRTGFWPAKWTQELGRLIETARGPMWEKEVRWSEVAAANGRVPHPAMQWASITGDWRCYNNDSQPGVWDEMPIEGSLPRRSARAARRLPTRVHNDGRSLLVRGLGRIQHPAIRGLGEIP